MNGIWLWSPLDYPLQQPNEAGGKQLAVATRNPVLRSFVEAANARVMITEAERMHELLKANAPLPKRIVLAGEGYAVLLTTSWLPKFGKGTWQPKAVKRESALLSTLYQLQT
ncbi:MAG: hypothetical protein JKY87_06085 [Mariprofundus sp.]|nr:hypothetical protein [Mariprofundus sp.]